MVNQESDKGFLAEDLPLLECGGSPPLFFHPRRIIKAVTVHGDSPKELERLFFSY
jgi:hypothetical protein